ncbi:MAG TPA: SemiSWEET family transporter [Candidatus Limnocylindria bacterium]
MGDFLGIGAAIWGVVMALSPILQIRRITLRGSSADVSLGNLAVLQIGFCLWVAYGITLGNPVIAVPNVIAATVGLATIGVSWRYRTARGR